MTRRLPGVRASPEELGAFLRLLRGPRPVTPLLTPSAFLSWKRHLSPGGGRCHPTSCPAVGLDPACCRGGNQCREGSAPLWAPLAVGTRGSRAPPRETQPLPVPTNGYKMCLCWSSWLLVLFLCLSVVLKATVFKTETIREQRLVWMFWPFPR